MRIAATMTCLAPSLRSRRPPGRRPLRAGVAVAGFSILETLIATALASILFATVASFANFTSRSFVAMGNYADLERASRDALDVMTRDIREARALTAFTSHRLTLTANDNSTLIFEYLPAAATLTRRHGTTDTILLKQCDMLNFAIFQRTPMAGLQFYPATNSAGAVHPPTAKLIDVSWRCSRKIFGQKVNTESVQTAKIVMRN